MKLLSVNVGLPREVTHRGRTYPTAIFKQPVDGRVMLRTLNLDGDKQGDLESHGGTYMAVYVYSHDHYDYWARHLGRSELAFGAFGENFTVEGLLEDATHIGDVFRIGGATVEVTQPRTPCYKLAMKTGSEAFPKAFLKSGRVGFYLRVLEQGEVGAGDEITPVSTDPERLTVLETVRLWAAKKFDPAALDRALRVTALSPKWRAGFEKKLAAFA